MSSQPSAPARSSAGRAWRKALRSHRGRIGGLGVLALLFVAILAPVIANDEPLVCRHQGAWHFPALVEVVQGLMGGSAWVQKSAPFKWPSFNAKRDLHADGFALWPPIRCGPEEVSADVMQTPSRQHLLGTDDAGRDVAARLVHGAAASLQIAFGAIVVAGVIGIAVGASAGYFGGWSDFVLSRLIEVVMCFPVLFLVLGLMVWLEPSMTHLILVIGLTRWTSFARYVRAEFLRQKGLDFVAAARAAGSGPWRIVLLHLMPNCLPPVLVAFAFGLAQAMLIETGLSWLGFGVPIPQASWGQMLRTAFEHLRSAPFLIYPPCIGLFVSVLSFNLIGEALRDAADPLWAGRARAASRPGIW